MSQLYRHRAVETNDHESPRQTLGFRRNIRFPRPRALRPPLRRYFQISMAPGDSSIGYFWSPLGAPPPLPRFHGSDTLLLNPLYTETFPLWRLLPLYYLSFPMRGRHPSPNARQLPIRGRRDSAMRRLALISSSVIRRNAEVNISHTFSGPCMYPVSATKNLAHLGIRFARV